MSAGADRRLARGGRDPRDPGRAQTFESSALDALLRLAPPALLASHGEERVLQRDRYLLRQGCPGPEVFGIRDGVLASYQASGNAKPEVFGFHYPRDLVFVARPGEAAPVAVKALTPARVLCFSMTSLFDLLAGQPGLALAILRTLCGGLMDQQSELFLVSRSSFEQRLATFFLDLGARLGREEDGELQIPLPMRRADIASNLGLRSETLSRIMARWKASGLVCEEGRHFLRFPDARRLKAMSLDRDQGPPRAVRE